MLELCCSRAIYIEEQLEKKQATKGHTLPHYGHGSYGT